MIMRKSSIIIKFLFYFFLFHLDFLYLILVKEVIRIL